MPQKRYQARLAGVALGDILVTNSPDLAGLPNPAHHRSGIPEGQNGIHAHSTTATGPRTNLLNTVGLCPCGFESRLRHW